MSLRREILLLKEKEKRASTKVVNAKNAAVTADKLFKADEQAI